MNVLSYGIVPRSELAKFGDPSLAGVLEAAVGPWGAKFIALGLIVSLVGALLSWFLMLAEIVRVPAQEGLMPSFLGRENAKAVPVNALWLTMGLVQLFLIWTYFNASTYTRLISLASALILLPYLLSALFQAQGWNQGEGVRSRRRRSGVGVRSVAALCRRLGVSPVHRHLLRVGVAFLHLGEA